MKIILLSLFIFTLTLSAKTLNIALAANVSYAIEDLQKEFIKKHPHTKFRITLGSSGKLTAQIKNGAPYDIFISANMNYPIALYKDKKAITKPRVYALGSLVYFSTKQKDFSKGVNLLMDKSVRKIAVANPKTAPYGKASLEVLENSGIYSSVKRKLVFAESASQTLSYAVTATDIGFIANSALFSPKMAKYKENINWLEVDSNLYIPIEQGIVILKRARENAEALAFYEFMFSKEAKEILEKFGYRVL